MRSSDYRILLAVDLKSSTERLVKETQRFAQSLSATVDIVHVAEPDPDFVGYIKGSLGEQTQIDVERGFKSEELWDEHRGAHAIAEALRKKGINIDQVLSVQGPLPVTLFEHVKKLNSDLLILGSHQHGTLYRLWYGDVAIDAVKTVPCALLVVPV